MTNGLLHPCRCWFFSAFVALVAMPQVGCGGSHTMATTPPTPLSIVLQPANASAPLGQAATFKVVASGTGTLTYQWSRDGEAIPGAIANAYTTPPVTAGDTGSTFSVAVQSGDATVVSDPATLTVGPRSPAAGDLRFQAVDSGATDSISGWGFTSHVAYPSGFYYPNDIGTPLRLGAGQCVPGITQDCWWGYTVWPVPKNVSSSITYLPDVLEKLDADLANHNSPNTVISSLDIEAPNDVFGVSLVQGASSGFDMSHESVALNSVAAQATKDGSEGRVVTAISFNDATGQVDLLSYGWTGTQGVVYETDVLTSSYDNIGGAASTLANAGYIITAFGGNSMDGYLLVGTRVKGDTLRRPLLLSPDASVSTQGYALVGWAVNNFPNGGASAPIWIYEQ